MSLLSRMTLLGLGHVSSVHMIPEPKESDPRSILKGCDCSPFLPRSAHDQCLSLWRFVAAEYLCIRCLGKSGL